MSKEIWKWAAGYKDRYQVSSIDRVRSVDRLIKNQGEYIRKGQLLSPGKDSSGYLQVCLGGRMKLVHHLVAEAFLGRRDKGLSVNHKNGNKLNNRLANLEYVTHAKNMRHAAQQGLLASKLRVEDVLAIRKSLSKGVRGRKLAKEYSVSEATISLIKHGKHWTHALPEDSEQ